MTVYIDPPLWPAHGTVFSHLISDDSLSELHAFAAAARLRPGAFDEDHYDVPAHRYADLVGRGAHAVSARELVRILTSCGLRVRSIERPGQVRSRLTRAWVRLLPLEEHDDTQRQRSSALGEELLDRWSEPHRHYHCPTHLAAVLTAVGVLHRNGELPPQLRRAVLLAAWFHDAVYAGAAGADEEDSALLAEDRLTGLLPDEEVAEVVRLVRLTATHDPAEGDVAGSVLVDADLEVLGRGHSGYQRYIVQVRRDFDHVPDQQFRTGRARVLASLLDRPVLFRTTTGHRLWEAPARENLRAELDSLIGGSESRRSQPR